MKYAKLRSKLRKSLSDAVNDIVITNQEVPAEDMADIIFTALCEVAMEHGEHLVGKAQTVDSVSEIIRGA